MNKDQTEFGGINGAPLFRTIRATCDAFDFPEYALRKLVKEKRIRIITIGNRVYINQTYFLEMLFGIREGIYE